MNVTLLASTDVSRINLMVLIFLSPFVFLEVDILVEVIACQQSQTQLPFVRGCRHQGFV